MFLRFLGTGAADWEKGMTDEFRAFTSTMVDGHILIDGTMSVLEALGDPAGVTDILFTHPHSDHFDLDFLRAIAPVRAHIHRSWADRASGIPGVTVIPFDFCEAFDAGGLTVTAVPSNHLEFSENALPAHFILEGDRTILYATDGAWMTTQEWRTLMKFQLDAAVFDATIGDGNPGDFRIFEHNSLDMVRMMLVTLRRPMFGTHTAEPHIHPVIKENAPIFLTHLARTLHPSRKELEDALKGEFIVAYDGMEVEI